MGTASGVRSTCYKSHEPSSRDLGSQPGGPLAFVLAHMKYRLNDCKTM